MVSPRVVNRIFFIVGPTAVGKSDVALQLAQKWDAEIINADSRQFYRELEIGTAKPSRAERELVPHHLIDCASITSPWQVAIFCTEAERMIAEIQQRNRLVLVVGGTGLYVHSLLYGLDRMPVTDEKIRAEIQQRWRREGIEAIYEELKQRDPESAKRLNPADSTRILRALEVVLQTGRPLHSYWRETSKPRFDFTMIGLSRDRKDLYERINARVERMFAQGLRREVENLWARYPDNPVLKKTIGYQEWIRHGFASDDLVMAEIQKNSRHFAKRQMTWFRHEKDIQWMEMTGDVVNKICDQFSPK